MSKRPDARAKKRKSGRFIHLIGMFKLVKASFLYLLAFGAFRALKGGAAETLTAWAHAFRVDPHSGYLDKLLTKLTGVSHEQLAVVAAGTLIYALLFTVEGVGLLMSKIWAEWLTVVATASLIPLEIALIAHHASASHVATFVVNALVVVYLFAHRLAESSMKRSVSRAPLSPQQFALRQRQVRASRSAIADR